MAISGVPRTDLTWTRRPAAELELFGRKVAVVGGTGGIGRAFARLMADRGAEVTVVGQTFRDEGTPRLSFVRADLNLMAEARRIGKSLAAEPFDLALFTTGIIAAPKREQTAEGLERDMAVSYLSRLVALRDLAPALAARSKQTGRRTRVFVMGFPGTDATANLDDLNSEKGYSAWPVHMGTVAGNEALVLECAKRHPEVDFFGLNPGLIKTTIRANMFGAGSLKYRAIEALIGLFTPSPEQYAERIAPLLFAPELDAKSGAMFNAKGIAIHASKALGGDVAKTLVEKSNALVDRALRQASAA